eukprot:scaffold10073_cov136-Isochrysis_galbana.AAC.10
MAPHSAHELSTHKRTLFLVQHSCAACCAGRVGTGRPRPMCEATLGETSLLAPAAVALAR